VTLHACRRQLSGSAEVSAMRSAAASLTSLGCCSSSNLLLPAVLWLRPQFLLRSAPLSCLADSCVGPALHQASSSCRSWRTTSCSPQRREGEPDDALRHMLKQVGVSGGGQGVRGGQCCAGCGSVLLVCRLLCEHPLTHVLFCSWFSCPQTWTVADLQLVELKNHGAAAAGPVSAAHKGGAAAAAAAAAPNAVCGGSQHAVCHRSCMRWPLIAAARPPGDVRG